MILGLPLCVPSISMAPKQQNAFAQLFGTLDPGSWSRESETWRITVKDNVRNRHFWTAVRNPGSWVLVTAVRKMADHSKGQRTKSTLLDSWSEPWILGPGHGSPKKWQIVVKDVGSADSSSGGICIVVCCILRMPAADRISRRRCPRKRKPRQKVAPESEPRKCPTSGPFC